MFDAGHDLTPCRSVGAQLVGTIAAPGTAAVRVSGKLLYQRGLLMHLTNPKSILAWIALMTLGPGSDRHNVLRLNAKTWRWLQ
ncbi:hypothetical protein MES5069_650001 [Mesorhizobium escarrei]|uniref:Uncharacterized protein n=1 Tax=Mesorhizobium escarrei TaxID=666018 RepID=A0ABM9EF69_9HYPH|nr:hypothetical protein MES5069_650001 [Mesorhizobium escarrei]